MGFFGFSQICLPRLWVLAQLAELPHQLMGESLAPKGLSSVSNCGDKRCVSVAA